MFLKKILLNILPKLIVYTFALPLVLIIRLIAPFIVIRWYCTQSTRIGHFCQNIQVYLAMKEEKKIFQSDRKFFDVFYNRTVICNNQLDKMWRRSNELFFLPNWFMDPINNVNEFILEKIFSSNNLHDIGYYYTPNKLLPGYAVPLNAVDHFNSTNESKIPIHFSNKEIIYGNKKLNEMGINKNDNFVVLILRSEDYLKTKYPKINWNDHSNRDTDIKYFMKTVKYLSKNNIKTILIGSGSPKNLDHKALKIINYENSKYKSAFMDIFLFSLNNCKLVITSVTGIDAVGSLFKKPILEIGVVPFASARTYSKYYNFTLKKYFSKSLNRNLTMKEIFETGVAQVYGSQIPNELEYKHPSEDEILNSTIEILNKIDNKFISNNQDKELQNEFTEKYKKYIDKYFPERTCEKHFGKITESYISMNKYLLN